jgi:tetratricopeptide (TPR) repeat protein
MAKSIKQADPTASKKQKNGLLQSNFAWFLGLLIFAFVLYSPTLGHDFVLDDALSLALNDNVTAGISGIADIITGSYRENNFGGQLYRPISLIQFAIEWHISPNNPLIHHFFNIFWFGLTIGLVFVVLKKWFPTLSILLPLLVALLFAIHPIHTEVVANIKSRDEIMALFFILASWYSWDKYLHHNKLSWFFTTLLLFFLALLSKETAITMFPIFGMLAWYIYQKDIRFSLVKGFSFLIPVLFIFAIRHALFGDMSPPQISVMDNPIVAAEGLSQRMATSMLILLQYIQLLIFPISLSSDYSYNVIPIVDFTNVKVWLSLLIHLGAIVLAILHIKKRSFISLSILGYLMSISLFSQIPLVIGTMFGERLAYLASFWWIAGIVFLCSKYFNAESIWSVNKGILSSIAILMVWFTFKTVQRSIVWKDNYTLFTTDAATYPQSVRLNNGAAEEMLKSANLTDDEVKKDEIYTKTEAYCNKIMEIKPVATAYLTLGNIRMNQKKYQEAIDYYDQVNDLQNIVDVNKALAYRELGRIAGEKEQNLVKSQELLSKSLKLNDKDAETWFLLGVSHGVAGNHQQAAEFFEKAYTINPTPDYAKNAIMAYKNLGNETKVAYFQSLLNGK